MALKRSSEIITVSSSITTAANAFAVDPIDLQLNPLDNEVFVVLGVKIDFLSQAPAAGLTTTGIFFAEDEVAVTSTRPTSMPNLSDSNCLAYASRQTVAGVVAGVAPGPPFDLSAFAIYENGPQDTPDTNLDYLGIVATSDMFLSVDSDGTVTAPSAAVRIYGYRAKADAATYAALVQSEVLSA